MKIYAAVVLAAALSACVPAPPTTPTVTPAPISAVTPALPTTPPVTPEPISTVTMPTAASASSYQPAPPVTAVVVTQPPAVTTPAAQPTAVPVTATRTPRPTLQPTPLPNAPTVVAEWSPPSPTRSSNCQIVGNGLPDTACTPGAVDPRVAVAGIASTICTPGYSRAVRPSTRVTDRIKRDQLIAYGFDGQPPANFELDHLISLELGGAPADVANLWPEPLTGEDNAHQKDSVENYLHTELCRGAITLSEAQREIATDWQAVYRSRHLIPSSETVD